MARDKEMTVLEHLEEFRHRLVIVVAAVVAGTVAGWFLAPQFLTFLLEPARSAGADLIYLAPAELFLVHIKLALITGLVLAAPVVTYEMVAFVWPGLEAGERRYLAVMVPVGIMLFLVGTAFAFAILIGYLLRFFFGFTISDVTPTLSVGSYLSFVINLVIPFGLVFQLPVALAVLARLDLVTPRFLARNRKYAALVIFVIAAFITPPDPVSQFMMAVPLLLLYEVSIVIVRLLTRGQSRRS